MTYDNERYYIFDCNGVLTGNKKGYSTTGNALSIANRRTGFIYDHLYNAYLKTLKHKLEQGYVHPMTFYKIISGNTLNKRDNHV